MPWVNPQGQSPIVGAVDINPADDSVGFSTNTGIWRVPADRKQPTKVTGRLTTNVGSGGISEQLIVRFRGPDQMIGSGHPPAGSDLPPALGMIESHDGGKSWTEISGAGQTDDHAIQVSGDAIVAGCSRPPRSSSAATAARRSRSTSPPIRSSTSRPTPRRPASSSLPPGKPSSCPPTRAILARARPRSPTCGSRGRSPTRCTASTPAGPSSSAPMAARAGSTAAPPAVSDGQCSPTPPTTSSSRTWTDRVTPPALTPTP